MSGPLQPTPNGHVAVLEKPPSNGGMAAGPRSEAATMGAIYPDLADRTVLVTGGASGIGAAIVAAFLSQRCRVGFLDMDANSAEAILRAHATRPLAFEACDLRDIDGMRAAVDRVRQRFGPITCLINNAARDDRHR